MFLRRRSGHRSPPNLWMIIASFHPHIGGAEQQAQRLSEQLLAKDWRPAILTRRHNPRYSYLPPVQETISGIPVYRVYSRGPSKVASLLFVLGGLWHLWRSGQGRLYHAHDLGAPTLLAILAKLILGGHCLVKVRSGKGQYEHRQSSLFASLWFWILRYLIDCFLAVSQEGVGMLKIYGIPEDKIAYIPNGVDTEYFRPATQIEKTHARHRLGLSASKRIVLYVGRLMYVKGIDILLNAWRQLPTEPRNQSLLLIVGDGREAHRLQRFAMEHGLRETVCFVGRQEDILDYLHAADIFVLPSRSEGLSNALIEAMACGLPVIASRVGGTPDLVEEGKSGFLYKAENHQELAQKLTSMIEMQDRWDRMGALGRETVSSYADLKIVATQLSKLYDQLN